MNNLAYDPLTGKNSIGCRFRFHVRSIAQKSLYLPREMKALPQVRQLIQGVSPMAVFACDDIKYARERFYDLRKKYDFPYWATLHYLVKDKEAPYEKVPLVLNRFQYYLTDIFIRNTNTSLPGKYFVTKSIPKCGLTTCVQAFILWLLLYGNQNNSLTFTPYRNLADVLKYRVADCSGRKISDFGVPVTDKVRALIRPMYEAPALKDGDFSYFHFADMMKWKDLNSNLFRRIYGEALGAWKKQPSALFVVEGDIPAFPGFNPDNYRNYTASTEAHRLSLLGSYFHNPYYSYLYILLTDPRISSDYTYINLDQAM